MKKILKFAVSVAMSAVLVLSLASCDVSTKEADEKMKNSATTYYEAIKKAIDEEDSYAKIANKIRKYLSKENFESKIFGNENIVVYFSKNKNSQNTAKRIFNISFSKENSKESSQAIGTILGVLKNSEKNGDVKVIITPVKDGYKYGLESIPQKEFEGYDFINLISAKEGSIQTSSPKTEVFNISKRAVKSKPKGELAYRIAIKGLNKEDSGDRTEKHPNPITNLGGILLRAKNADINIEIINFASSGDINKYPYEGSVEVVIEKGSQEKFEERLKKAKEDFIEKNQKLNPKATFEYEQIKMPNKVYSYNATTDILSLIYTLEDGVFSTTERDYKGDVTALDTIANISTENNKLELGIMARAISNKFMDEMRENFKMTAAILGFTLNNEQRSDVWEKTTDEYWKKSGIYEITGKKIDENKDLFIESPGAYIVNKYEKVKVAEVRFNYEDFKKVARGLKKFIEENTSISNK